MKEDLLLYFRHIQKTQFEHQGINQHVLKVYVVEHMFNTLTLSHETIYNPFSGQDVPPTFKTIMTHLIQENTRINTWHKLNASTKEDVLVMKMQFFFPYEKVPSNYGRGGGGSRSRHGSNNYRPLTFGITQHVNHSHVGPC
jgi:hypothetical protein